jgi:misacylated tRNA(Ala) deacylase
MNENPKNYHPASHSAEHILNRTMDLMFGCGRAFSAHIEKKKSKCDYRFDRDLTEEEKRAIEARVNEVIGSHLEIRETFLDRHSAAERFNLSRLPEEAGDQIRIITVGDYDACPCSGIHASNTDEIGTFSIVSSSHTNGVLRLRFKVEDPAAGTEQ